MRIVAAMAHVVGERGVGSTTVAHVVARAGVSRRTFYDLFEDRQACFLATFNGAVEQAAVKVVAAFEAERRWVDGVRAGLFELLVFMEEAPELARLCVVQALAAGPVVLERRSEILAQLAATVDRGRGEADTEPPPLSAAAVVGAVFSVIHAQLAAPGTDGASDHGALTGLLGGLMAIVVLPFLGSAAAGQELVRPAPELPNVSPGSRAPQNPLEGLDMRLTYRTLRVLAVIAEQPGASNRDIADQAGISDQGQISKLLTRLERLGLIENTGEGYAKGSPNSWQLTPRGADIQQTMAPQARSPRRRAAQPGA